jgi:hypothetical protein
MHTASRFFSAWEGRARREQAYLAKSKKNGPNGQKMAETLGSLCDKLTVVKLKQWHSTAPARLESLQNQERQLCCEIDDFVRSASSGAMPLERLTFASNKVYKREGNSVTAATGTIGQVFSHLASVNCKLWHEQEKVYDFENVPPEDKNCVVKQIAMLNLERTECVDAIDRLFRDTVAQGPSKADVPG